jgi:urate oxidase/2-oxo-4-hydroxy-4-carboxy-5-ureidoimidazoline decarboxylase
MERFASGVKRNYYGKGDVTVYRLHRDGLHQDGHSPVFAANVLMLVYGDAFWPTYATGDNSGLIATDSMKNFIQRETLTFDGDDLADYCRFLATTFAARYPQVEGVQVSATALPYDPVGATPAFAPGGPDRATARVETTRDGIVDATAGIRGFRLLRLGGSAFHGFVRDEYTTLPEIHNRPLHMWLDVEWRYGSTADAFGANGATTHVRQIVHDVFRGFESGSIQQVIYQIGSRVLEAIPAISDVHLEANNRTWDTVAEHGDALGVYTDARPPYGCLGLRLTR